MNWKTLSHLNTNPTYHAIGLGVQEIIQDAFPYLDIKLGIWQVTGIYYPQLDIIAPRERRGIFDESHLNIGTAYINATVISFHGLTDYTTAERKLITEVDIADPKMDSKLCEATWKLIDAARTHQLMRECLVTPMEKAGVGPGLDDD